MSSNGYGSEPEVDSGGLRMSSRFRTAVQY